MKPDDEPMSPHDFAAQVDWEGSITEVMFAGINNPDDLNDDDEELKEAWEKLCALWPEFYEAADRVSELLDGYAH